MKCSKGRSKIFVFTVMIIMIFLSLGAIDSFAHGYKIKALSVGHIWTKPTDTDSAPIYGSLLNSAGETEHLMAAQSPVAEKILFRIMEGNIEKWPDEIVLEPNKPFSLAPWQAHLWLSGLKVQLKEGESFPLTLTFSHAGTITIDVIVESQPQH